MDSTNRITELWTEGDFINSPFGIYPTWVPDVLLRALKIDDELQREMCDKLKELEVKL